MLEKIKDFFYTSSPSPSLDAPLPEALTYTDRLRLMVGSPLKGFPTDVTLWADIKNKSIQELARDYEINYEQAIVLSQSLLLLYELSDGAGLHGKKKAPGQAKDWARLPEVEKIVRQKREHLMMFIVDAEGNYTDHLIGIGTRDYCYLPPFPSMKSLYQQMNGKYFLLVHNHPTKNAFPSDSDIEATEAVLEFARANGMWFKNHIIVSRSGYYSMARNGHF
ncbi:JAB domain-containing protein [Cytobacillus sp. FJAT-54145]|uniref:JAB domain-containing protein n=1 Tax=Cytobacillus spartinae TaxID=3299023 RepID=A0ABW6KAT1_9BACI